MNWRDGSANGFHSGVNGFQRIQDIKPAIARH
jgi:hypothetical protein